MPTARIAAKRLREHAICGPVDLKRVYGPQLRARGFVEALDFTVERTEGELILRQEIPWRLANNDPQVWPLLQRIAHAEAAAVGELLSLLLANNDDRAEVIQEMEVALPGGRGGGQSAQLGGAAPLGNDYVYADHGQQGEGDSDQVVSSYAVATRELCGRVLLLMGAREEML